MPKGVRPRLSALGSESTAPGAIPVVSGSRSVSRRSLKPSFEQHQSAVIEIEGLPICFGIYSVLRICSQQDLGDPPFSKRNRDDSAIALLAIPRDHRVELIHNLCRGLKGGKNLLKANLRLFRVRDREREIGEWPCVCVCVFKNHFSAEHKRDPQPAWDPPCIQAG